MPNFKGLACMVSEFTSAQNGVERKKEERKKETKKETRKERFARKQICLCVGRLGTFRLQGWSLA